MHYLFGFLSLDTLPYPSALDDCSLDLMLLDTLLESPPELLQDLGVLDNMHDDGYAQCGLENGRKKFSNYYCCNFMVVIIIIIIIILSHANIKG